MRSIAETVHQERLEGQPTNEIDQVIATFRDWAQQAGISESGSGVSLEDLGVPHRPTGLLVGYQGVYTFQFESVWLKAGKAGPKSGARWQSQHYKTTRSLSNLSWSLLQYAHLSSVDIPRLPATFRDTLKDVRPDEMGDWIQNDTRRVNLLISGSLGERNVLHHLEHIAHDVLKPVFEGRWNA